MRKSRLRPRVYCVAKSLQLGPVVEEDALIFLYRKVLHLRGLWKGPRGQAGTQGQRDPGSSSVVYLPLGFLDESVGPGMWEWLPLRQMRLVICLNTRESQPPCPLK